MLKKKCKHKEINILIADTFGDGTQYSGIGHICKKCGAVRDSVKLGSRWKVGDIVKLCKQLADKYDYPWEHIKMGFDFGDL